MSTSITNTNYSSLSCAAAVPCGATLNLTAFVLKVDATTRWLHKGRSRDTRARSRLWRKMCPDTDACRFLSRMHRQRIPTLLQKMGYAGASAEVYATEVHGSAVTAPGK